MPILFPNYIKCFSIQLIIRQRAVTTSSRLFLLIADVIFLTTLSKGITQNSPSPFAIRVSTRPGRISVTIMEVPFDFCWRDFV